MQKISAESKDAVDDTSLLPISNLVHASDDKIDETVAASKNTTQSSHLLPRPTKKRKTTQFATHVPIICQMWTSLSPQERLKWEQAASIRNESIGSYIKDSSRK